MNDACTLVICGSTGNLSRIKLLPALYQLERAGRLPDQTRNGNALAEAMETELTEFLNGAGRKVLVDLLVDDLLQQKKKPNGRHQEDQGGGEQLPAGGLGDEFHDRVHLYPIP